MTDEQNKDEMIPQEEPATVQDSTSVVAEATEPTAPAPVDITATQLNTPEISTPKKSKTGLIIGIVAAVVAVVVAVIFATGAFADPQAAVAKAFAATQAASEKASAETMENFPIMKLFNNDNTDDTSASKTNIDITFESITTGTPDDTLINGLLRGAGIRGAFATDPATKSGSIDLSAYYTGTDLIGISSYLSPELITVASPFLTDTVASFNPKTLAADASGSAIALMMGWTDADLQEAQDLLTAQADAVQTPGMDYETMTKELYAIMGKALTNATYEKVGKQNGLTDYAIALTGADLKTTLVELGRYIYLDSDMAATMEESMRAQVLMMGMDYTQFINENILNVLENELEFSDSTLTISVDSKSYITRYQFAGTMTAEGQAINITLDMNTPSPMVMDMVMNMDAPAGITAKIVAKGTYDGDFQDVTVTMDMTNGMGSVMTLNEIIRLGKDGTANLTADISVDDTKIGIDIQGSIVEENGNYTIDYPVLKLLVNDSYTDMAIALSATAKVEKLESLAAPTQHTPLFSMSDADLQTELLTMQQALYDILNQVAGGLF